MPHFITRDGAKLHYYDVGRGPLCVMLHGFGMASELWLPLVLPLARKQRFVLLSQRGFGRSHSQSFSKDCIMTQLAEDLADLLNHLDVQSCHLAGYSMGACASMQYLSKHPDPRIKGYLNIDQAACTSNQPDWAWGVFGPEHERWMGDLHELLEVIAPLPAHTGFADLPKALRQRVCEAFSDFFEVAAHKRWLRWGSRAVKVEALATKFLPTHNWRVYLHCMKAYATQQYDFRAALAPVDLPVWNFVGDQSRMYDATGQLKLHEVVAGPVTNVHFQGCGHALPFEAPRRFTRKLGEFLSAA
jgi:pimeloyl-ACP methyl ester carboxylesterase